MKIRVPMGLRARIMVLFCGGVIAAQLLTGPLPFGPSASLAQEEWKVEFDTVCSKTDVVMTLSVGELKDLVARCVKVQERIEAQEDSTRKVYLRRLQMCSDLYKYVLENKEQDR